MSNPNNLGDLTAVGATRAYSCRGRSKHIVQFTVSGITGGNVLTVRLEGNVDQFAEATGYFNLSDSSVDTSISADGTYAFSCSHPLEKVRFNWITQSGVGASITDIIYGGE